MFYKESEKHQYNHYDFICDSETDISDLPTLSNEVEGYYTPAPGSTAFVIDGTVCYMYGNDNEWHEI